jgi:hypothetical protein
VNLHFFIIFVLLRKEKKKKKKKEKEKKEKIHTLQFTWIDTDVWKKSL